MNRYINFLIFFTHKVFLLLMIFGFTCLILPGCISPQVTERLIQISISADGKTLHLPVSSGTTVQTAIMKAGLTLGNLDRLEPAGYTVLTNGTNIKLIRVTEKFDISEVTIPFQQQTVKNESLGVDQQLLIQPGINGLEEITTRVVYEDGVEVSKSVVKSVIVIEAVPEITMVGIQAPFKSIAIPGRMAYLVAGNAWLMEIGTEDRTPIVTTGDLDGRVFSLSPDRSWLLYTRKSTSTDNNIINSLWVVKISNPVSSPINLNVTNVVLYADWVPNQPLTISYSTVEPRSISPGWQANNDFQMLTISSYGSIISHQEIISTNSGGIYGWWGTTFAWSPDGSMLAYSRPDEIGLVNISDGTFEPKLEITPLQTNSDWAWVPPIDWSPDNNAIFTVVHSSSPGLTSPEESQSFNLSAILVNSNQVLTLIKQSGMFANPIASPVYSQQNYQLSFLQAIFPDQSDTSHYKLAIINRDGANIKIVFPQEESTGLNPQDIVWSPVSSSNSVGLLAFIFEGNIWLVNTISGEAHQITGDGLTTHLDWK
jgi:resuscitation-promoting factor RpfB